LADVFLSYAREDRDLVRRIAGALESKDWTVWWDRNIIAGHAFDEVIERELRGAKCIVVFWSKYSVESEWVKNEAAFAAEQGKLVPALIADVNVPLEFRRKQTVDLSQWLRGASDHEFIALCNGIADRVTGNPPSTPVRHEKPHTISRSRVLAIVLVILAAGLTATAVFMLMPETGRQSASLAVRAPHSVVPSIEGSWTHSSGVTWMIKQRDDSIAFEQFDPKKGITAIGNGKLAGRELHVTYRLTSDGSPGTGTFTLSEDSMRLAGSHKHSGSEDRINLEFIRTN
jgi:hypothetical protein